MFIEHVMQLYRIVVTVLPWFHFLSDDVSFIFAAILLLARTTDHRQATGKLYHLRLRVECTLFCNLQSRMRTHAVLVIGLYELLVNPTT
jgi:hypothetical protein